MIDKSLAIIGQNNSIPFSALSSIINKTAQYYFRNGVKTKKNIAILGDNSIEYVITIFALWKIGAIPVPINTRLTKSEIRAVLLSSDCNIAIADKDKSDMLANFTTIEMCIKDKGNEYNKTHTPSPNDTAVIIHTSGSSDKPKGVKITNNNLYKSYTSTATAFNFSNSDRFLASLPFYHIGGFAIINRALLSGGVLILPQTLKQDSIVESMQKYNPTIISLVPTMLKRILKDGVKPNARLRHLFLGGGPSDDELIHSALQNNWTIVKVYGASETTAMVTGCWGDNLKNHPASAGKPFGEVELIILDEHKNRITNNSIGEITIKSPGIANGYINNDALWKTKIYKDFYLTGDFGYLDKNGNLFVVARRTDLIVSGGENINPREIENVLNKHPQITESVVLPIKNKEWGEIPLAVIVLKKDCSLSENEIYSYLKGEIASYKIPKKIFFVDSIPKTELGKIDIQAIKAMLKI